MTARELGPTEIIQGAAQRLAGHMGALRDAHDDHQVPAGPHDDLSSPEYSAAAELVYRETLGEAYLRRMGMTFGAVVVLMDLVAEQRPEQTMQRQWVDVRAYFSSVADRFAPGYEAHLDELPSLGLATKSTPPIVRFELLAGLASRPAVLRLFDAANWVDELVGEMPDLSDAELGPAALAALAAGWTS